MPSDVKVSKFLRSTMPLTNEDQKTIEKTPSYFITEKG